MQLKVQLISDKAGTLVIKGTQDNPDPDGLNILEQTIKRSVYGDGVVKAVSIELGFFKLGRQFLEKCAQYGVDHKVLINIFEYNDTTRLFDTIYYTGQLNLNSQRRKEDFFYVTADQSDFQTNVLNFIEKEIDVETILSANNKAITAIENFTLRLHSKRILYQFNGTGTGGFTGDTIPAGKWLTIDPQVVTLNEIKTKSNVGINVSDTRPDPVWVMDNDGDYTFIIYVENNNAGGGLMNNVDVYYSINGNADVVFTRVNATAFRVGWNINITLTLKKGDTFRYYVKNHGGTDVFFNINTFTGTEPLRVAISNLSTSPESTAKAYFMRDVIQQGVRFATGQNDCFKSSLLNRTELGGVDGEAALDFTLNGQLIRKRDKSLFWSLKESTKAVGNIYGASIGFEKDVNGVERFIVENKDYFFDKSSFSVDLGSVYDVEFKINYERLFNNFVLGYTTVIDIGQVNAIDGFNTIRKYILNLINSKNNEDYSSSIITDGFLIEYERRLIDSTADGRYDDKNFLIRGYRDAGYRAKKDDGYTSITGIIDPSSGYNYDLSPARISERWKKYLAQNLIWADQKKVNFSSGTGNYEMTTTKAGEDTVNENGGLDLAGVEPYTTPYDMHFICKTTNDQFNAIKSSPYKFIQLTSFAGVTQGFISKDGITHKPNEGIGEYNLMEVFRK